VGDVVRDVNGTPIERGEEFETWLHKNTKPGQTIDVTVDRVTGGKTASLVYQVALIRRPLEMIRPESRTTVSKTQVTDPLSFLLTLESLQGEMIKVNDDEFASCRRCTTAIGNQLASARQRRVCQDAGRSRFEKDPPRGFAQSHQALYAAQNRRSFQGPAKISLGFDRRIENTGEAPLAVAYRLDGPNGIPLEGWWYSTKMHREMFRGAGARDVLYQLGNAPHQLIGTPMIYDNAKKALKGNTSVEHPIINQANTQPLTYAGVDAQFFAAMVLPKGQGESPSATKPIQFARVAAIPMHDVNQLTKTRIRMTNTSVRMVTTRDSLAKGASLQHHYQVFLGPKDPRCSRPMNSTKSSSMAGRMPLIRPSS